MVNSAFAVSAAFTMAFDNSYIVPVIVGKLAAGMLAVILSGFIFDRIKAIR